MRGSRPTSVAIGADLGLRAAVRALLVDGDALADDVLLELVERELGACRGTPRRSRRRGRPSSASSTSSSTALVASWRASLSCTLVASSSCAPCDCSIWRVEVLVDRRGRDLELLLRRLAGELELRRAELLDLAVRDVERVEHLGLGDLVGARLDHQDGLVGARDHEVEVGGELLLLGRVDDEVAVDLADPHRADGRRERDVGDHQGRRRAVHREDVVRVVVVDRQRDRDELRLVAPALREERAQRAVDHAGDQRRLLAGAALALEERAGDLAGRVHPLLDVDRERHEVDVAQVARPLRCPGRACRRRRRGRSRRPAWPGGPSRSGSPTRRSRRRPGALLPCVPFSIRRSVRGGSFITKFASVVSTSILAVRPRGAHSTVSVPSMPASRCWPTGQ